MESTRLCPAKQHTFASQRHETRETSIILFRKNPEDPNSPLLKYCLDCRLYSRTINRHYVDKNISLHKESKERNDGYLYCPFKGHEKLSTIPRDKVPEEMFRKLPNNPKSLLLQHCSDCRGIRSEVTKTRIQTKKNEAIKVGQFYCTNCHHSLPLEKRSLNLDGTFGILCIGCKAAERIYKSSITNCFKLVKMEKLIALNASCTVCKSIYIRSPENEKVTIELRTFETDEGRMAVFDDETFLAKDIIQSGSEMLELDILEFDHLTEDEQRTSGLLLPDEPYIPKIRNVSKMSSEHAIRLEASKCQLVCSRCHVGETVRREVGLDITERSHTEREKMAYVNEIKKKGCEICSYVNIDLLRFFHLDHIKPVHKSECIARMVKDNKYSLDDVKKELIKCRVLCGHCHKLHTKNQRLTGELQPGHRKVV